MIDKNGKIKIQTGDATYIIYTDEELKDSKKNNKNYKKMIVWDALANNYNYGVLKDNKLSSEELSIFVNDLKNKAGKDCILDINETYDMAKELGISFNDFKRTVEILSAQPITNNLVDLLNKNKLDDNDKKNLKSWINRINSSSIEEVWYGYNRGVVQSKPIWGLKLEDANTTITKDIMKHFSFNEAKPMFDKIFKVMCEDAERRDVNIETLKQQYTEAMQKSDVNALHEILDELGKRLINNSTQIDYINNYKKEYNLNTKNTKMTQQVETQIEKYATTSGADVSEDLKGNGELGDTQSVPTKVAGKINNPKAAKVLEAINELMQDPIIKEKLEACVNKKYGIMITSFPGNDQVNLVTENSLTSGSKQAPPVQNTVVGDSDMTNFITAILKAAQGQVEEGQSFNKFNDKEALKEYILYLVEAQ